MDEERDDERVGYKQPPRHTRFKKGQSGNPRGRRKGAGVRSAAEKVLDRKVMATVDGQRQKVPITEALVLQLAQKALAGDSRATRDFLKIADQVSAARGDDKPADKDLIIRFMVDPRDCNPALEALGIIINTGERYKISPWVYQAAMARRPVIKPSDEVLIKKALAEPGERPDQRLVDQQEFARLREAERQRRRDGGYAE